MNALSQRSQFEIGSFEPVTQLYHEGNIGSGDVILTDEDDVEMESDPDCVLSKWTDPISVVTGLQRARDIKDAYVALVDSLLANGSPGSA